MYILKPFEITNPQKIASIIETYDFATLVTCEAGIPNASHLPFLYDAERGERGTLISHMAKVNPQWQSFAPETEVLAIFQGSHSYSHSK